MLFKLVLLFTVVPLLELFLLLWIGERIGVLYTFGIVLVTGFVGAALARWQGFRTWQRIHQELAAGQMPGDALLDGLMILIAGGLLVTPGVLTDAVGFSLLLPPLRAIIKRRLVNRFQARLVSGPFDPHQPPGEPRRDETIESRIVEEGPP